MFRTHFLLVRLSRASVFLLPLHVSFGLGLRSPRCRAEGFVQSTLKEHVYTCLSKGCGRVSGKVVKLARSLVRFGASVSHVALRHYLVRGMLGLGLEQCGADACVMRHVEGSVVAIVVVVHVDDIFRLAARPGVISLRETEYLRPDQEPWGVALVCGDSVFLVIVRRARLRCRKRRLPRTLSRSPVLGIPRRPPPWLLA